MHHHLPRSLTKCRLGSPGRIPSPYLHQIVGGNAFAAHMDPKLNLSAAASCTTCTYARDYSNYWTPVLFFRHRNGSYHRVPLKENVLLEGARGGMTVYLTAPVDARRVTAFKPVSSISPSRIGGEFKLTGGMERASACLSAPPPCAHPTLLRPS